MNEREQLLIVTPEQLKNGYETYHHGQVPNVHWRPFIPVKQLPNGNWVVKSPTEKVSMS